MMTRVALLLLIAASLYCTVTAGTGSGIARDCCLSINPQPLPRRLAASYQLSNPGCNIKATLFTTKKGIHVCAPPPEESAWVRKLIALLDENKGTGSGIARDCCLSINPQPLPRRLAASYQLSDPGCNIKATVFTTKKGKQVCNPPPEESEWVRKLIALLDKQ